MPVEINQPICDYMTCLKFFCFLLGYTCLKCLELVHCSVFIPKDSLVYLDQLKSLKLQGSRDCQDPLTQLTNLVYLDLTSCHWDGPSDGFWDRTRGLSGFVAWPALRVFKFGGCPLIRPGTVLNLAKVDHLHTQLLTAGMELAKVHLDLVVHKDLHDICANITSPLWCNSVVELKLVVPRGCASVHLATAVSQLLEFCSCLQIFHFNNCASSTFASNGPAEIVFCKQYQAPLTEFSLKGVCCSKLDLESCSSLTEVTD